MMWVNVLMWLYFCGNISIYLYTYLYVCGFICGGISGALWIDELCGRWEQKHFCQPLFGRRDSADPCCTLSFTDFNLITTRTGICRSAPPVAAGVPWNTGQYFGWGLHCLSRLRIPESCLNPGIKGLWQVWQSILLNSAARPAGTTGILKDEMSPFVSKTSQPDVSPAVLHMAFFRHRVNTETWASW